MHCALCIILFASCTQNNWLDWKTQNDIWLQQNILDHEGDKNFHVTESGLQYLVINEGILTDARPDAESIVYIDYSGRLITGVEFDSGESVEFDISSIITGLAEGLKHMHRTGDFIFYIPQDLAYGSEGSGSEGNMYFIPPYSTLIFEVHLVDLSK